MPFWELWFAVQGSQVSCFLVAFESAAGIKGGFKHFKRKFLFFSTALREELIEYRMMLRYKTSL